MHSHSSSLVLLPLLSFSFLDPKPQSNGHQMGSVEANVYPSAASSPHLTIALRSSQSWACRVEVGVAWSLLQKTEISRPQRSRRATNQSMRQAIKLLELHPKLNMMKWCLSSGTELLDVYGFIGWIFCWDYDTSGRTSVLGHFFHLSLWAKANNWNSHSPGKLFFILFLPKEQFLYFSSNFLCFLSHCREIHYEAEPFLFILPQWRRGKRDRLSRIDNE